MRMRLNNWRNSHSSVTGSTMPIQVGFLDSACSFEAPLFLSGLGGRAGAYPS